LVDSRRSLQWIEVQHKMVRRLARDSVKRIESVEDLARARLMVSRTRPTAWADWASCSGHSKLALHVDESFDHFYLLIQGARCGLGLANVPRMLVRDI